MRSASASLKDDIRTKMYSSNNLMGSGHKNHPNAKPVTPDDKLMSDEHKRRRSEIDDMATTRGRMAASLKYNLLHAKEHIKAAKKTKSLIASHDNGKFIDKYIASMNRG